ncbi:hypothetical protein ACFQY5_39965 [Paeniroseomonas aquatica]|uniref:hypothetical protein n=1 Tax=Paeniroseomonas aquatica TaxID=373043 RepID=UPI00360F0139
MSDNDSSNQNEPPLNAYFQQALELLAAAQNVAAREPGSHEASSDYGQYQVGLMELRSLLARGPGLLSNSLETQSRFLRSFLKSKSVSPLLKAILSENLKVQMPYRFRPPEEVFNQYKTAYSIVLHYTELVDGLDDTSQGPPSDRPVLRLRRPPASQNFRNLTEEEEEEDLSNETQRHVQWVRISKAVPEQQIAPVYFDITGAKIVLKDVKSDFPEQDKAIVDVVRAQAIESGRRLIEVLQDPNRTQFSARYLDQLTYLQDKLENDGNAIAVAMANVPCQLIIQEMKDEIMEDLQGLMTGHAINVHGYVAQFPDFHKYSDNINSLKISQDDIRDIQTGFDKFLAVIEENLDRVDVAVVDALKRLRQFLSMSGEKKTSVFAVLRTVGNWISNGFEHIKPFFTKLAVKTSEKTIDGLATVISKGWCLLSLD